MIRRARRLAFCVLFTLLASFHAAAQSSAPPRVVEIEVAGSSEAIARFRAAASEVLGRLGVTSIVRAEGAQSGTGSTASPLLAQAYVDLEELRSPRLVVVEAATRRELARRTLETSGSLETSVESVTLVLYMVMEALLSEATPPNPGQGQGGAEAATASGGSSASPRAAPREESKTVPEAPRPVQKERPKVVAEPAPILNADDEEPTNDRDHDSSFEPSTLAWGAGAFLRVTTLDNTHALTGAGASLEAHARRASPRPGVLLLAAVHGATEVGEGETQAELDTLSARLLAKLELPWGRRAAALFGVGGGVDWFRVDTRAPAVGTARSASILDAALCGLVGVRVSIAAPIVLNAAAGLDLDLEPREFVSETGGVRRTLFEIERFRPSLMLGLSFSPGFAERGTR